jgi:hypothetical protein
MIACRARREDHARVNAILPLQRVRLELVRALRVRPFVARALRGTLEEGAWKALVVQLARLVETIGPLPDELALVAQEHAPCAAVRHFGVAAADYAVCLTPEDALNVLLAVVGTSWIADVSRKQARRAGCSLLEAIAARGPESLSCLRSKLSAATLDPQHVYGFAELVGAALLGIATYLDLTWPAPRKKDFLS